MGLGVNICVLLVGLAAFAGWTFYSCTAPRRAGWVNLFGGIGILALFFSIVSPDDGGFQPGIDPPSDSLRKSVCADETCTAAIAVRFGDQCVCKSRESHSGSQDRSLACHGSVF